MYMERFRVRRKRTVIIAEAKLEGGMGCGTPKIQIIPIGRAIKDFK